MMVAAFAVSPVVISVCITLTAAMTIRQEVQQAPAPERLSAMVRAPRGLPQVFPPPGEIHSPRAPAEGPSSAPQGEVTRRDRQTNGPHAGDGLSDRIQVIPIDPDWDPLGTDVNVIGGHNSVHVHDKSNGDKQSRRKEKGKQGRAGKIWRHRILRNGGLLGAARDMIHKVITAPMRLFHGITRFGNNRRRRT